MRTVRVSKDWTSWITTLIILMFNERYHALRNYKSLTTIRNWNGYKKNRNLALASVRRERVPYLQQINNQILVNFTKRSCQ